MMLVHDLTALPDLVRNSGIKIQLEEGKRGVELLAHLAGTRRGFVWRFNSCKLSSVALRDLLCLIHTRGLHLVGRPSLRRSSVHLLRGVLREMVHLRTSHHPCFGRLFATCCLPFTRQTTEHDADLLTIRMKLWTWLRPCISLYDSGTVIMVTDPLYLKISSVDRRFRWLRVNHMFGRHRTCTIRADYLKK